MKQKSITSKTDTYLLRLIFKVKKISSEIKEEVLYWSNFIFDLCVELEDRRNQYEVLPPYCMKIMYLNIHFSCSVYIY
jgi:hypothetical protein